MFIIYTNVQLVLVLFTLLKPSKNPSLLHGKHLVCLTLKDGSIPIGQP